MKFLLNTRLVPMHIAHCSLDAFPRAEDAAVDQAPRPAQCAPWWEGWARSTAEEQGC